MDKSLQQQLYGNLRQSSFSRGPNTPSSSNKSNIFKKHSNIGGLSQSSSHFSVSGRSTQTILGIRSEFNVVESYGFQLPVLVTEALTFSEKSQSASVKCSDNGWAWVVHGRRLLIWQYKETKNNQNTPRKEMMRTPQRRPGAMAQCRELTLTQCDIGHKAALITVFFNEGQQMASCVAVSPTGDVRYWPSIAHDGSSVDLNGILAGQEFDYLLHVPRQNGYVIATTTCNLVFLQLQLINGRHVLQHKTIRQPSGFLGGIGKRFASIVGINSGCEKENKFINIACAETADPDAIVYVLADHWLQRWRLANNCTTEQLIYEDPEVVRKLRDEFIAKFWNIRLETIEVDIHMLDMHIYNGVIYILAGAVNNLHTPQMYYGIGSFTPGSDCMNIVGFIPLKYSHFYSATTEQECWNLHFTVCHTHIYVYTDKLIYPINLSSPNSSEIEADKIEFHLPDDGILCTSVCNQLPLFFSRIHGLVCVTPGDFNDIEFLNLTNSENLNDFHDPNLRESTFMNENSLRIYDLDPDAIFSDDKDEVNQLKAAFVYHLKHNFNMANSIINELLISTAEVHTGVLGDIHQLDKTVISIAEDLAEDIPSADPRWESWEDNNANKHALGSSISMQIITQLREKNLALRHFVEFLHNTGIWNKLSGFCTGGSNTAKATSYIISDINEKIIGAIGLRTMQSKYSKIIDEAINRVLVLTWKEHMTGTLTAQDIFYVRVCKFQDILNALCDVVDLRIDSTKNQMNVVATFISEVNTIVLHILSEIQTFRTSNTALYTLPVDKTETYEYHPWTAMSGSGGARDALTHLVDITLRHGARCTNKIELRHILYQQSSELIDFILNGRKAYLDSVRDTEKFNVLQQQFESQRRLLISQLIDDAQYEFAAKLAEKYLDFQSLVIICDETKNQDRLDNYIKQFEEYDFSQFAINWHLRQNRQGEVFERFKGNQAALSQFMQDHPTLGWIQLVFNGDFERAAIILLELAENESEYVQRKKTILSLAKLCSFAAPDSDLSLQVQKINTELNLIEYQEHIPDNVLQCFGFNVENQRVIKVEEMINLFISDDFETASELDFRKALELLKYMEEPDELRLSIWCAAILRDSWIDYDPNNAIDYLQDLLFFKLIELSHLMDGDVDTFLPTIDELLNSDSLMSLVDEKSFQYLLKLTYEYVNETFRNNEESIEQ